MDEIDAALDFRNVSIIANYIKERTKGCQFVVVSLRNVRRVPPSIVCIADLCFASQNMFVSALSPLVLLPY